jgi:alkylhydroperoxidase family enzyme
LLAEAVDFEASSTLTERQKVALRLHEAFLTHPAGLVAARRAETLAHYTPAEIVELAFKFFWWSSNRATVTLGEDAPHDPDRLTSFHYDPNGVYVVHAEAAASR